MSSSISSVGGYASMMMGMQRPQRPDSSKLAEELFSSLDSDGDGKVTQDEMTSGLQSLMESLDSQYESMRMSEAMGGMGNMPPPPPPQDDTGFTKEELEAQLDEIGSSDSKRSALISNVVENFEAADADGDGRVTFQEAMAYDQSSATTAASSESATTTTTTTSGSTGLTEAELMLQVMKLVEAYGLLGMKQESSALSAVA